jgi:hypothetical protein
MRHMLPSSTGASDGKIVIDISHQPKGRTAASECSGENKGEGIAARARNRPCGSRDAIRASGAALGCTATSRPDLPLGRFTL